MKEYFEKISDPRQQAKVDYSLHEVIIMTICAVISGCEIWEDIVDFCRVKESLFKDKLNILLENGVASHDTFQRVFQLIRPVRKLLRAIFLSLLFLDRISGKPPEIRLPRKIRYANYARKN